jgi:hypothetical protein
VGVSFGATCIQCRPDSVQEGREECCIVMTCSTAAEVLSQRAAALRVRSQEELAFCECKGYAGKEERNATGISQGTWAA